MKIVSFVPEYNELCICLETGVLMSKSNIYPSLEVYSKCMLGLSKDQAFFFYGLCVNSKMTPTTKMKRKKVKNLMVVSF